MKTRLKVQHILLPKDKKFGAGWVKKWTKDFGPKTLKQI
jgi:hypothetical protein